MEAIQEGLKALGINLPSLLAQLINFSILLGVLYLLAYKPLLRFLDERRRRIQEGLQASEEAKERLAQTEKSIQAQLEQARQEGQAYIGQAQQVSARIQEEGRQQAQVEAERLLGRARREIQLERDSSIAQLRQEFGDLTVRAAERVIRRSLDREAHGHLIQEVLAEAPLPSSRGGDDGDDEDEKRV